MRTPRRGRRSELDERQVHLLRLRHELIRLGVRVRVRKPRNGRWKLKLRTPTGWTETVLCAGAEGVYVYVTAHGRLPGRVQDARIVARTLVWMLDRRRR